MWSLSLFPTCCWLHLFLLSLKLPGPWQEGLGWSSAIQQTDATEEKAKQPLPTVFQKGLQGSEKASRFCWKSWNHPVKWNVLFFFFFNHMPSGYHDNQLWFKNMILVTQGDIVFLNKKRRIALGKTVRNIFQEATSNFRKQHKWCFVNYTFMRMLPFFFWLHFDIILVRVAVIPLLPYWVVQRDFSVTSYGKTRANFLANPIFYSMGWKWALLSFLVVNLQL